MAKLYFYYAAMNAGKSTTLLQADYNYRERGMKTMLWTAALDDRAGAGTIGSRIALSAPARTFDDDVDLFAEVGEELRKRKLDCVLVDEAQFLSQRQVLQLCEVADELSIPVLCYGLRTDFQGKLFPGSAALLALADTLVEHEHHLFARQGRRVDHHRPAQAVLQVGNRRFDLPLTLFRSVIFRILAEVAVGARFLDGFDDGRPLFDLKPAELVAQLAVSFGQHRHLFGTRHCQRPFFKTRPRRALWPAIRDGLSVKA
jgi:thymidine kinase